ncbi:MAG: DUF1934 domain-containing protein [Ruminococcus sp.]|nr:DUF1934 domain-containing protein [Ruminococcus sp.]
MDRYKITVVGEQTVDGEKDKIEVITEGDMTVTDGKIVITYPEYTQDTPAQKTDTTVAYENGVLSIDRQGEMSSHLILEQGVRHECLYNTPMGQMFIGIFTDSIKTDLDENGGTINAAYQLDFNRTVVSYNEFHISVKAK